MVVILYHDDFIVGHPTSLTGTGEVHQEAGDRISAILGALKKLCSNKTGSLKDITFDSNIDLAADEQIYASHSKEYLQRLSKLCAESDSEHVGRFSPCVVDLVNDEEYLSKYQKEKLADYSSTRWSKTTLQCAKRAVGAVLKAVNIARTKKEACFCLVRPPGHHATSIGFDKKAGGCGFCIFNNVCIGAAHMLKLEPDSRIVIVDFDVHHGNGTQEIVEKMFKSDQVLYISLHLLEVFDNPDDDYFPGSGRREENNDQVFNVPLKPLWAVKSKTKARPSKRLKIAPETNLELPFGREGYRKAVSEVVCPRIVTFEPSVLMFSAGFDANHFDEGSTQDGVAGLDLTKEDFGWITDQIIQCCSATRNFPVISVLEGGYGTWHASRDAYDRESLVKSCIEHVKSICAHHSKS